MLLTNPLLCLAAKLVGDMPVLPSSYQVHHFGRITCEGFQSEVLVPGAVFEVAVRSGGGEAQ